MIDPPSRLVLLGHPVAHSISPRIQNAALRSARLSLTYEARDVDPGALDSVLRELAVERAAGNVTIPFKELVAARCVTLTPLAAHCTRQEDAANKVERQVRKSAAACLLVNRIDEHFEGLVTGASEKGTWVRVFHPPVEGKLVHGWEGLEIGDKVRVKLLKVAAEMFVPPNRH